MSFKWLFGLEISKLRVDFGQHPSKMTLSKYFDGLIMFGIYFTSGLHYLFMFGKSKMSFGQLFKVLSCLSLSLIVSPEFNEIFLVLEWYH